MTTAPSYKVVPAGAGQTLWVAGGRYTVKASGEDTGGAYALMELLLPPASRPPAAPPCPGRRILLYP